MLLEVLFKWSVDGFSCVILGLFRCMCDKFLLISVVNAASKV